MDKVKYPIGGYAPGDYYNRCRVCNDKFVGDKLAIQCEPCSINALSNRIQQLEAENKTLRESAIDECLAIAKEAFNHQWPLRSCVDKFIALKALNQEKDG